MTRAEHLRLIELRRELGSRTQVAAMLDVHPNTIGNYERGEMPAWYPVVIEELVKRKRAGKKASLV